MAWVIEFSGFASKAFKKLDKIDQKRIDLFITKRLLTIPDPKVLGAQLSGKLRKYWKFRVGDYRLICEIKDKTLTILVVAVGHRRHIYKNM